MKSNFSSNTVEAIGACVRAMEGPDNADAILSRTDEATLSGLRAAGDRLALRARYHVDAVHEQLRPADALASAVFDALELARLDALGARWLEGVAKNLLAHPGRDHHGLRWLAFEILSGRSAPKDKQALVDDVRAALRHDLLEGLAALTHNLSDQRRFAAASAAWSVAAAAHLGPSAAASDSGSPAFPWLNPRVEYVLRPQQLDADARGAGKHKQPAERTAGERRGHSTFAAEELARGSSGDASGYRVFTTAHDRVVTATDIVERRELADLRAKLEAELSTIRPLVSRLAKRLLRVLMAQQVREWQFDLDEGVLDGSRLAPLVASRGRTRPFKQESESPFPSTVVTLLIDHSGSMRGRPMLIAALTVEIFARALERCGVRCEVLGFTTREWDGGEPAREWAAAKYPANPGRLNALEHIIVKAADVPWRRARTGLGLFLHDEMLKENIDGEALLSAHSRLMARAEQRRILIVVSDGTPMDEATAQANGFDYLDDHLHQVVRTIERQSPIQLAAIGIGHDVSRVYANATKIAKIDQLGPALTARLLSLLTHSI
jgi:cobaltochelatase CobT